VRELRRRFEKSFQVSGGFESRGKLRTVRVAVRRRGQVCRKSLHCSIPQSPVFD
jgi:hypothetical protein